MSVYTVSGSGLSTIYGKTGSALASGYDINGNLVFSSAPIPDYDHWDTPYQYTILQARDEWAEDYRRDSSIIPLVLTTDQHGFMNTSHGKPLYDYLSLAVNWTEASACLNLGDVCPAAYTSDSLDKMLNALSAIPKSKQINIAGNHDTQLPKAEDSSYSYAPLTDELFHVFQNTYFNNTAYDRNITQYGFKGMEMVTDSAHHVRYCIFAVWYTRGDPWYHYYMESEAVEAMISMLSVVDNNDIVILSHIQPYGLQTNWYIPAVDGEESGTQTGARGSLGYTTAYAVDNMIADRQARRSGTMTDADGVVHSYDFSNCTSDILCCLSGHTHADIYGYSPDDNAVSVTFDAYRYDNAPAYFVNIDRAREQVNVWKFDEANGIYNYQVPFEEP